MKTLEEFYKNLIDITGVTTSYEEAWQKFLSTEFLSEMDLNTKCKLAKLTETAKELAERDPQTKLLSYEGFSTYVKERVRQLQKANPSYKSYILFGDLNNFREINNKYDHLVGDEALEFAASVLLKNFRRNEKTISNENQRRRTTDKEPVDVLKQHDLIARHGKGDEFTIFMGNCPEDIVIAKINCVQEELKKGQILEKSGIYVSLSISIAYLEYNPEVTFEHNLRLVDNLQKEVKNTYHKLHKTN